MPPPKRGPPSRPNGYHARVQSRTLRSTLREDLSVYNYGSKACSNLTSHCFQFTFIFPRYKLLTIRGHWAALGEQPMSHCDLFLLPFALVILTHKVRTYSVRFVLEDKEDTVYPFSLHSLVAPIFRRAPKLEVPWGEWKEKEEKGWRKEACLSFRGY